MVNLLSIIVGMVIFLPILYLGFFYRLG
jgi:hypothetical protein